MDMWLVLYWTGRIGVGAFLVCRLSGLQRYGQNTYFISLSYKEAGDQEKALSYLAEILRRFPDSPYVSRLTEDLAEE